MAVKSRAIRQAEVDARKAEEAQEREQSEAIEKIRDQQVVMARLTLWLLRYVWPRLTEAERSEVKQIIPDEIEAEIKAALEQLP